MYVRGSVGVASIMDKTRENRRLDGLVVLWRREDSEAVMELSVEGRRGRVEYQRRSGWTGLSVIREDCWCVREWCGLSSQVEVEGQGGRP